MYAWPRSRYELPPSLAGLRGIGVNIVNAITPLKHHLANTARGKSATDTNHQTTTATATNADNDNDADEWLEAHDAATGKGYFYHATTREARWERPQ